MWVGDGWGLIIELDTDRQLQSLMERDDILRMIEALAANLKSDDANVSEFYGASISTQEYVDREYSDNWFGAHHNGGKRWKQKARVVITSSLKYFDRPRY